MKVLSRPKESHMQSKPSIKGLREGSPLLCEPAPLGEAMQSF